jgi:predicted PurR-regulated permease PerM
MIIHEVVYGRFFIAPCSIWGILYDHFMKFEGFDSLDRLSIYKLVAGLAAVIFILWGCVIILMPFFPAMLLALIFVLSTWPAFVKLEEWLDHQKTLAASLMTLLLAVCFLVPLLFLGSSVVDNYSRVSQAISQTMQNNPTQAPVWMTDIPVIGERLNQLWQDYSADKQAFMVRLQEYQQPITNFLISSGAAIGRGLLDLALGVIISFFLFRHGLSYADRLQTLIENFIGSQGRRLLKVSKNTLIGIVYGVLGTALAQGVLAAIGFWIAGVPGAPLLGLMTFFLSFIPMGPPLIWVPVTIWLFSEGMIWMGVFMAVYGLLIISFIDNFIRPYFISVGSNLPLLLVLFGVFGGLISFGFIGLFIGPTLLALAYTLIIEWTQSRHKNA